MLLALAFCWPITVVEFLITNYNQAVGIIYEHSTSINDPPKYQFFLHWPILATVMRLDDSLSQSCPPVVIVRRCEEESNPYHKDHHSSAEPPLEEVGYQHERDGSDACEEEQRAQKVHGNPIPSVVERNHI